MIPGYKPFFEKHPPAIPANVASVGAEMAEKTGNVSNISNFSKGYRSENTADGESICERAAIQEYDADMAQNQANMAASADYDRRRQSYELANPDRDPAVVESLYQAYIDNWKIGHEGDVPAVPPNTRNNTDLWRQWWCKLEEASR